MECCLHSRQLLHSNFADPSLVCAGVPGGVHDAGARRPSGRGARYRGGARAALRSTSAARKTRMSYSAFEKKIAEAMGVQNIEEDVKGMLPTFL